MDTILWIMIIVVFGLIVISMFSRKKESKLINDSVEEYELSIKRQEESLQNQKEMLKTQKEILKVLNEINQKS